MTWQKTLLAVAVGCLALASPGRADEPRLSPNGFSGALLLTNDARPSDAAIARWLDAPRGEKLHVVVIELGGAKGDEFIAALPDAVVGSVAKLAIADRTAADDAARLECWDDANYVAIVSAGECAAAGEMLHGTKLHARLNSLLANNGRLAIAGPASLTADAAGLALLPGWRVSSKSVELADRAPQLGVELPSRSTLFVRGRFVASLGEPAITLSLAKSDARPARSMELKTGEIADYNELRRAARGRSEPAFPAEPGVPEVKSGALVIIGGGGMPDDIGKRFVELGGGEKGRFIVLPTAMPDPLPRDGSVRMLQHFGAKEVAVISVREQRELETPENLELLKNATGVWFGGGRQWRFVDAYEGTKLHALFRDVLARGGVIGGSSAGATIQGEYLARGAPAGPHIMMCEGYERGLNFLPGTAIDQHFTQRKRFPDMTALMKAYPQYLGIGLDEATAIVVQGHTAEVLGKGAVHFYDRKKETAADQPDYEAIKAGAKYDLKERRVIEPK